MLLVRTMIINLLILTSSVYASELNGFDGFDWGSSRDSIIQVKGNPTHNWGDLALWFVDGSETVGGYPIHIVRFNFKEGCSKLKEAISEPCFMWGGEYSLLDPNSRMFEELTPKIVSRYGQYTEEVKTSPQEDYRTGKFLGNHVTLSRIFNLGDGSRVTLSVAERDRTWTVSTSDQPLYKGVIQVAIAYHSSEYLASSRKATANKSKDF